MNGRIQKILEKRDKGYWLVNIDGQSYSVWDPKYLTDLKTGDGVEYEWKESGKFRNITNLKKLDLTPDPDNSQQPDRDLKIIRMSCLKSATCLLPHMPDEVTDRMDYVMSAARKFEEYVLDRKEGKDLTSSK
jgi:hypothetical protein